MSNERKLSSEALRKIVFAEMNVADYRVKIFKDLLAELDGKGAAEETEAEETTTATKKAATTAKKGATKKVEAEEVEAEEVESNDDDMFGDGAELDNEPTVEDVRKVVKQFSNKHGKDKAMKLLGKFKVTAIPDLKKADYQKVIDLSNKHMGA